MGAMIPLTAPDHSGPDSEAQVQSAIRLALGQLPDVRVWRNSVGELPAQLSGGRKTRVKFGLAVGSSDLLCIVGPRGRWLAIEVKAGDWKPARSGSKFKHEQEQRDWIAIVENFGGVGGFARSVDEAMELVERARR
jgi:hypothetical protein